jgi:hypothetical protein
LCGRLQFGGAEPMLYFLLHDADAFHRIASAFAISWRNRDFGPVVDLAANLQTTFADFGEQFRLTADERPLLTQLAADRPFDRRLWRHLAGEALLYAADDAPAIQTAPETLAALVERDQRDAVQQAHAGVHDLEFDGVRYRPGRAGLNDMADVARLANDLAGIDPAGWTEAGLASSDEPAEEMAFARECFDNLRTLYDQARQRGQVVVCEDI